MTILLFNKKIWVLTSTVVLFTLSCSNSLQFVHYSECFWANWRSSITLIYCFHCHRSIRQVWQCRRVESSCVCVCVRVCVCERVCVLCRWVCVSERQREKERDIISLCFRKRECVFKTEWTGNRKERENEGERERDKECGCLCVRLPVSVCLCRKKSGRTVCATSMCKKEWKGVWVCVGLRDCECVCGGECVCLYLFARESERESEKHHIWEKSSREQTKMLKRWIFRRLEKKYSQRIEKTTSE